jgi:hypothetical protein
VRTQIHIYTINRDALDAFATEWRDKIKPLREKFGFHVSGGWKVIETNQFLWFLSLDDSENWETQNQAFHQSAERRSLNPDPARHIARVEQYFVDSI